MFNEEKATNKSTWPKVPTDHLEEILPLKEDFYQFVLFFFYFTESLIDRGELYLAKMQQSLTYKYFKHDGNYQLSFIVVTLKDDLTKLVGFFTETMIKREKFKTFSKVRPTNKTNNQNCNWTLYIKEKHIG